MSESFHADVVRHLDHGTQRAILRLHRSASPAALAAAGVGLDSVESPALVLWGEQDFWLPPHLADALAAALGGETQVVKLPAAGHWPWLDDDRAIACVSEYLEGYRYCASATRDPV